MKYLVRVGPTAVKQCADKLRAAGFEVTCEGTERVHVVKDADDEVSFETAYDISQALGWKADIFAVTNGAEVRVRY